jgi:hypothetical protein
VFVPGFLGESVTLSVANDQVVWTEQAFDPRWGQRNYSVIKVYDLGARQQRQLSQKTRLGAPAFSPDGRLIVAVQVLPNNTYNLVLLDGETGQLLKTFDNPENDFYITPRFTPDGQAVVAVKRNDRGKTIEWMALRTGERKELVPYSGLNLNNPVAHGDYVYFNSPRNGIDNIFAVHVPTGRQFQVTNRKFGAYNAALSPDGREMAYQDFTPDGFRIVTQPVDSTAWTPLENVTDRTVAYYQPLIEQEGGHSILGDVPRQNLPVRRYRQWKQLFNPYSWGPLVSSSGQALEVSLSSQDLLSTTLVDVGYGYDANQNTGSVFANLSYQGWYPVLDATFSTGMRQTSVTVNNVRQDPDTTFRDTWRENRFSAGVRLPFNFTRSKYSESLSLGAFVNVTDVSGYGLPSASSPKPATARCTTRGTASPTTGSSRRRRATYSPAGARACRSTSGTRPSGATTAGRFSRPRPDCCCRAWGGTTACGCAAGTSRKTCGARPATTASRPRCSFRGASATKVSRVS